MVKATKLALNADTVAQLCVEYWKLIAATEKSLKLISGSGGKRLEGQLKFSKRQLDVLAQELGLRLVDYTGEQFHPGLAVSIENPGDHGDDENLTVGKTLEPTVMSDMTVVRLGRVILEPFKQKEE
ncbi:hypothetical protein [Roseovarius confluentis]|uniref:hypothetical protein n=1 Tax=Roseovarius confluentis TaxID=1852027 RepID=UPI003BABD982